MNTKHHFLELRAKNKIQFSSVIQKHLCFFITPQTLRFKEHLQKLYPSCLHHHSCLHMQYIKTKNEEKECILQRLCLEIVLSICYKLVQDFCLKFTLIRKSTFLLHNFSFIRLQTKCCSQLYLASPVDFLYASWTLLWKFGNKPILFNMNREEKPNAFYTEHFSFIQQNKQSSVDFCANYRESHMNCYQGLSPLFLSFSFYRK